MHTAGIELIDVNSRRHGELITITDRVAERIPPRFTGLCQLQSMHTTAGLTINENADPDVAHDLLAELERLVPWKNPAFSHMEGNSAAHLKTSLVGVSLTIPVVDGSLVLGTWQGIFFCEFDGPRNRRVAMLLLPAGETPQKCSGRSE